MTQLVRARTPRRGFGFGAVALAIGFTALAGCESTQPAAQQFLVVELEVSSDGAAGPAAGHVARGEAEPRVFIDGRDLGKTNELIEFLGGACTITLEDGEKYEPASHDVTVASTSALAPMRVAFTRKP